MFKDFKIRFYKVMFDVSIYELQLPRNRKDTYLSYTNNNIFNMISVYKNANKGQEKLN